MGYLIKEESDARIDRVKALLQEQDLDAALVYYDEFNIGNGWYLTAWCRMRGGRRIFRTDRVRRAALLEETAPDRSTESVHDDIPSDYVVRPLEFV